MNRIAVIYWSGTGNTQMMAEAVAQGAKDAGAEVTLLSVSDTDAAAASSYDALALGCPAMGGEVLEESNCPARRSYCSAPMTGEMDSGCGTGSSAPKQRAQNWLLPKA